MPAERRFEPVVQTVDDFTEPGQGAATWACCSGMGGMSEMANRVLDVSGPGHHHALSGAPDTTTGMGSFLYLEAWPGPPPSPLLTLAASPPFRRERMVVSWH